MWGLSALRPVVPSISAALKGSRSVFHCESDGVWYCYVASISLAFHMRKQLSRLALPMIIALSLVACSASGVPGQLPFAEPGVSFTVVPSEVGCTPTGSYRGEVRWEVPGAMSSKIEVQVGAQQRQLFARSNESVGSEKTGVWVSKGMVFVLVDRTTGMVLAAIEAGPGQCNEAAEAAAAGTPSSGE